MVHGIIDLFEHPTVLTDDMILEINSESLRNELMFWIIFNWYSGYGERMCATKTGQLVDTTSFLRYFK